MRPKLPHISPEISKPLISTFCEEYVLLLLSSPFAWITMSWPLAAVSLLLFFSRPVMSDLCNSMDCSTPGLPVPHHLLNLPKFMSIVFVMPSSHLILFIRKWINIDTSYLNCSCLHRFLCINVLKNILMSISSPLVKNYLISPAHLIPFSY